MHDPPSRVPHLAFPLRVPSGRMRDTLLDVTEELLAERDFGRLKVRQIAHHANSSVGSFYARFESKEELLDGLLDRFVAEREEVARRQLDEARWQGVGLAGRVRAVVTLAFEYNRSRPALGRALARHRFAELESARSTASWGAYRAAATPWSDFLLACRSEIGHPDPGRAVPLALYVAGRAIDGITLAPPEDANELVGASDEEAIANLCDAVLRLLDAASERRPSRGSQPTGSGVSEPLRHREEHLARGIARVRAGHDLDPPGAVGDATREGDPAQHLDPPAEEAP